MMLRPVAWPAACLVLWWLFYRDGFCGGLFSLAYIFGGHHVAPWGVLSLCVFWLVLKRDEVKQNLPGKVAPGFLITGACIVWLSFLLPEQPDFILLKFLAGCLGLFIAFFGRAGLLPARLLAVYAWTVLMPVAVQAFLERPYALAAVRPAVWAGGLAGLPLSADGQMLTVYPLSGDSISVTVTAACAGPATMAVFTAIFMLMFMDLRLPGRTAAGVFIFGAAGTWLQSVVRIVVIMACGYYGGAPALWQAHFWTVYLLFPLWYLVFAAVYFKVLSRVPPVAR